MILRLIRYLVYLSYFPVAGAVWLAILIFGFGFLPFSHERLCDVEPVPCPEPSILERTAGMVLFFSIVPLTVLGFVLLRNWLHRKQGLDETE